HRFDMQFVREGTDVVLGSIPVVLGTPISGDGYEFEDCDDGVICIEADFGNHRNDGGTANVAPSFTTGADQVVAEDSGPQTVMAWATNISPGPASESSQLVDFIVSNDNTALFAAQPTISSDGTLTYTPAADAFGLATVSVLLHDDGGTASGGSDTSAPQLFTISISPVNDAPVGLPVIVGAAQQGQILTADTSGISDADGLGPFAFQWLRDAVEISGATAGTYSLSSADVGSQISVQVSYTDGHGTAEGPLTSLPTAPVTPSLGSIVVTPTTLVTTEGGAAQSFEISLGSVPTAMVTIPINSSDTTEGTISVTEVVFAAGDSGPVTVSVSPVDDLLAGSLDGDIVYSIVTGPAISADTSYDGLDAADVSVTNLDNDVPIMNRAYADVTYAAGLIEGTESGVIADTHDVGLGAQAMTEASVAVTGGRKPKYGSALEYHWSFPGLSGATTFGVDAFQSSGADDNFRFEYTTDGGTNWTVLGTIDQTTPYQNLTVTGLNVTGDVLVRVIDTDRSPAKGSAAPVLDTVTIDHLYFESLREDLRPIVTVTAVDAAATENNPADIGLYRFERSEVSSSPLDISYSIGGTATNGADYDLLSATITIPADQTFVDLQVNPIDDLAQEGTESIVLTLQTGTQYRVGSASAATVMVADDDVSTYLATSENTVSGSVAANTYTATFVDDGVAESIQETTTNGKKSDRTSLVEHEWTLSGVTDANSFYLLASRTDNAEGDDFVFSYSTDNGGTWTDLATVNSSTLTLYPVPLSSVSGTVIVRVVDTDRTAGSSSTDTITVDQMYLSSAPLSPLVLSSATPVPTASLSQLTIAQVDSTVNAAIDYWTAREASSAIKSELSNAKSDLLEIAASFVGLDLSDDKRIDFDGDTDGFGWTEISLFDTLVHEIGHHLFDFDHDAADSEFELPESDEDEDAGQDGDLWDSLVDEAFEDFFDGFSSELR
ncbi:MAG: hypothetical protein KDB27_32060, partial [Planctomycetales bacterium]|nr:hypothetical protein [Planctomycetales bacterium]